MWRFSFSRSRSVQGRGSLRQYLSAMALFFIGAVAFSSSPTSSQLPPKQAYSPEAEGKFARGVEAYFEGNFSEALGALEEVSALPSNQRSSAALLLASRALVRLDRFTEALDTARRIEIDYPGSRYTADARLVAGDCHFQLKRYRDAAAEYARLLTVPGPLSLQASAAERLAGIVRNRAITAGEREEIRRQLGARRFRDAVLFGEARWYSRLGWKERSHAALTTYLDSVENGLFAALARRTLSGSQAVPDGNGDSGAGGFPSKPGISAPPEAGPDGRPAIGIPMPLSGSRSYAGQGAPRWNPVGERPDGKALRTSDRRHWRAPAGRRARILRFHSARGWKQPAADGVGCAVVGPGSECRRNNRAGFQSRRRRGLC